jgi:hypothetical protein
MIFFELCSGTGDIGKYTYVKIGNFLNCFFFFISLN